MQCATSIKNCPKLTLQDAASDVDMEDGCPTTEGAKDAELGGCEGEGASRDPGETPTPDPAVAKTQGAVQAALKSGVIQEIILNRPDSFQLQDMV